MAGPCKDINVLFIWEVPESLRQYLRDGLRAFDNVNLIFPGSIEEEVLIELAPGADIMVGWRPSRELLITAKKLRLLINPGAGVKHHIEIFRELNKTRKILLANGHGNTYFTAQHVVALLLALMNKIIPHHNWMSSGRWRTGDREGPSSPLRNRTIGLLGYGAVNTKVHRFLSGFDVDFAILRLDWDKQLEPLPTPAKRFWKDDLHAFLECVDILIIAVPHTTQTDGLIKERELKLLGTDGFILNISRGQVIDEGSLYNALKEHIIAGAAIDVWYNYRPEPDEDERRYPYSHPFHELDNIVMSPHRGASPMDDLKRWDEVILNISRVARGDDSLINIVSLDDEY
jgi:phosphoglycerate dehydrogenase-like enzyme